MVEVKKLRRCEFSIRKYRKGAKFKNRVKVIYKFTVVLQQNMSFPVVSPSSILLLFTQPVAV